MTTFGYCAYHFTQAEALQIIQSASPHAGVKNGLMLDVKKPEIKYFVSMGLEYHKDGLILSVSGDHHKDVGDAIFYALAKIIDLSGTPEGLQNPEGQFVVWVPSEKKFVLRG